MDGWGYRWGWWLGEGVNEAAWQSLHSHTDFCMSPLQNHYSCYQNMQKLWINIRKHQTMLWRDLLHLELTGLYTDAETSLTVWLILWNNYLNTLSTCCIWFSRQFVDPLIWKKKDLWPLYVVVKQQSTENTHHRSQDIQSWSASRQHTDVTGFHVSKFPLNSPWQI